MQIATRFDPFLVTLSISVAIFASYVALNLAHSVTQAKGRAQLQWLGAGAIAMGVGIWSMHFIGMLAFEMPGMMMAYDVPLLILSVVVAIGGSGLALYIISRSVVPVGSVISGGIAMASAIAGMHYIGMFSMRMGASIQWNPYAVTLSIVIALVASFGALFVLIRLRDKTDRIWQLLLASSLMGVAISGMHYTGMLAADFVHTDDQGIKDSNLLVSSGLAVAVVTGTILILGIALISSVSHRLGALRKKKADEILGKSEEKFRRLMDAVKDYAIFMLDPNGYVTMWNLGAERANGYSEKEIIGKHVSIFYTKEDIDDLKVVHELNSAKETGHYEGEGRRVRKDGSIYWANAIIAPLYDSDGAIAGFSKVTRDITLFKESEKNMRLLNEELESRVKARTQALEQRENQLRSITNALPALIAQFDCDERLLFANDAFVQWFQGSSQDIIEMTFKDILGPSRYVENEPFIRKVLDGEVITYERESQSGSLSAILGITFVPEFDREKRVIGFIVLASNITNHKEIETELKKAKEAAEVANATKSAFLANMSHEIRTPLGAVLGFSELLLDSDMTPSERYNSVEVIKRNGLLLSNIINDILDLSKVEAGKLEVERIDVPFNDVLKEIGAVLSLEAAAKGIELKVISEGVIPFQIKTDPLRLRQILLNIVGNAIKFTNRGFVTVRVKLISSLDRSSHPQLAFIVKDSGEGIQSDHVKRLFKSFTQADVSTTRKFGGTGLGLTLSKKLANALGGDVVLTETALGKGSTFTVTIDPGVSEQILFQNSASKESDTAEDAATKATKLLRLPKHKDGAALSTLKILVVDDSLDNQALIKKILTLAGAAVEVANNGIEAIRKVQAGDFNLILMDLQMPEMDGYSATKILRAEGFNRPIIALTAHAMSNERQRSLASGFNEHITKPIDHELLVKTVSSYSVKH